MLLLQFGIGASNDAVDAPRDMAKAGKPIPRGLVSRRSAVALATGSFAGGLVAAVAVDPVLVVVGIVVISVGLVYDLALKGTAWSWLPFAIGIPILPVFGWLASPTPLPGAFAILVPTAVAAGAALAIGNALADVERDRAANVDSVATRLGASRAWVVQIVVLGIVAIAAVATAVAMGRGSLVTAAIAVLGLIPLAAAVAARGRSAEARERAWEVEAIATGFLAIAWLLAAAA